VSRGLLSPRGGAGALADLFGRTPLVDGQRVGPARRRARRARALARLARRAVVLGVVLAGVAATLAGARWATTSPRFAIAGVEVHGASRVPVPRILAAAAIVPGTNLWTLDGGAVAARVSALPEIRRADIVRELPNRVTIVVEERRPFTLVHAGRLHWMDEEGRVLSEERRAVVPGVPVISGLTEEELVSMRTSPGPKARAAVALIRALLRSGNALARPLYRRWRRGAAGRGGLGRTARAARRRAGAGGDTGRERRRPPIQGPGRAQTGAGAVRRGKSPELIVGLDVGTTKVCAIVAAPRPGGGLDVVGVGAAPSRGLRRGIVVNIDSTVEAIRQAVAEAERMAGVDVSAVYAGVAGGHIRSVNSRGVVAVSGKDREVSQADVDRAVDAARAINISQDREILHVLPQTFMVDDADGVREPLGMSGVRLEVEVHVVTAAVTSVQNVIRSVNRAGLTVQDVVLEPIASAEAVLYPDEKELGVLVIDIGGGTTDLALLRDGAVWHTAILPLGGDHISNDVAVGLRTPLTAAEALKKHYGCALTALVPAEETVDVPSVGGRKPRQLSRQVLSEIIQPRVEEIFSLVAREMTRAGFEDAATAGVVVTGGSSIMQGVPELAESVFDQPVRRGVPGDVSGLVNVVKSPVYATAVGLALYGARRQGPLGTWTDTTGGTLARLGRRLIGWLGEVL